MKIKQTIERECCSFRDGDLVKILDAPIGKRFWYFCKHCGRHFRDYGGSEPESPGIQPLPWPWDLYDLKLGCQ